MKIHQTFFGALLIALATSGLSLPATAQSADTPYGTAKFAAYSDIESVKQLKVVWDFNFVDPNAVGVVFNNLNALLKATAEYGPRNRADQSRDRVARAGTRRLREKEL